jgi:hypothetical protein
VKKYEINDLGAEVFKLHDTYGIPIEFIADYFFWCWNSWMKEAIRAGWKYEKIRNTIFKINSEIFGKEWEKYKIIIPKMYIKLTESVEI